jgi:hypothetical protein
VLWRALACTGVLWRALACSGVLWRDFDLFLLILMIDLLIQ